MRDTIIAVDYSQICSELEGRIAKLEAENRALEEYCRELSPNFVDGLMGQAALA